jgi:DNA-binding GntR family transcriptional regulator
MSANDEFSDGPLLEQQAYVGSRELLVSGELASGTFLSESRLVDRLGMSKTPIRAALERLAAEEFISVSPRRGAVVRELTVREVADQYDIRSALEPHVLRGIAGRLSLE